MKMYELDESIKQRVMEMDKSQTPPGRDGSNSDSDAGKKEYSAKATTAKKVAKSAEKILTKELNKKKGVSEMRDRRDAYQRDYDSSQTGFGQPPREEDESNLMYIYKDEHLKQAMIDNQDERQAHNQGFRDTKEAALKLHGIIRSKFNPKKWVQKQGAQWVQVYPFGKPNDVEVDEALPLDQLRKAAGVKATNPFANAPKPIKPAQIPTGPVDLNQFKPKNESATAGATSAANVGVGAVYKNKPPKQPKNKDGTAKNALDMNANLMTGGSIKR